jgi:cadherin 23
MNLQKYLSLRLTGSLIYKLKGFDPDGDVLDFGVQSTYDSDVITVKNLENNEAGIYLEKELDREVS